jgi:uncharacterized RDD family membrane protein YckC
MPPARLGIRALAFLLDFILLTALATFIIWKIAMPQAHPGALAEFHTWTQSFLSWISDSNTNNNIAQPKWSENLTEALTYARDLQILIFWLYFGIGEAFFGGSSLGKSACRLRSISTVTMSTPPIMAGIARGGLKTLTLFFVFPIALLATLGTLLFNKRRQMGHDLLSRTVVIDEKYLNLPKKSTSSSAN